jgi:hypothetical protein
LGFSVRSPPRRRSGLRSWRLSWRRVQIHLARAVLSTLRLRVRLALSICGRRGKLAPLALSTAAIAFGRCHLRMVVFIKLPLRCCFSVRATRAWGGPSVPERPFVRDLVHLFLNVLVIAPPVRPGAFWSSPTCLPSPRTL